MKRILLVIGLIFIIILISIVNKNNRDIYEIISFKKWQVGDIINKDIIVSNDNNYNILVRILLQEEWSDNLTGDIDQNHRVVIINYNEDWKYNNGYYYYKYYLKPNEETSSIVDNIKFSSVLNDDDNYYGYKNNIYKIKYKIETIKYEKNNEWNIDINKMKPMSASDFINLSNDSKKKYNEGNIHTMYTFSHEETELIPFITTDYRYIGNDPYNYVKLKIM